MSEDRKKKAYEAPKLTRLGNITQLTTGGSGSMMENFGMMMTGLMLMRFP